MSVVSSRRRFDQTAQQLGVRGAWAGVALSREAACVTHAVCGRANASGVAPTAVGVARRRAAAPRTMVQVQLTAPSIRRPSRNNVCAMRKCGSARQGQPPVPLALRSVGLRGARSTTTCRVRAAVPHPRHPPPRATPLPGASRGLAALPARREAQAETPFETVSNSILHGASLPTPDLHHFDTQNPGERVAPSQSLARH